MNHKLLLFMILHILEMDNNEIMKLKYNKLLQNKQ